jgi:hypothetical protein
LASPSSQKRKYSKNENSFSARFWVLPTHFYSIKYIDYNILFLISIFSDSSFKDGIGVYSYLPEGYFLEEVNRRKPNCVAVKTP